MSTAHDAVDDQADYAAQFVVPRLNRLPRRIPTRLWPWQRVLRWWRTSRRVHELEQRLIGLAEDLASNQLDQKRLEWATGSDDVEERRTARGRLQLLRCDALNLQRQMAAHRAELRALLPGQYA